MHTCITLLTNHFLYSYLMCLQAHISMSDKENLVNQTDHNSLSSSRPTLHVWIDTANNH